MTRAGHDARAAARRLRKAERGRAAWRYTTASMTATCGGIMLGSYLRDEPLPLWAAVVYLVLGAVVLVWDMHASKEERADV